MDWVFFAYLWGCSFVNAPVFSVRKKWNSSFVFIEDVNLWGRVTHEYHKNWAIMNLNDSIVSNFSVYKCLLVCLLCSWSNIIRTCSCSRLMKQATFQIQNIFRFVRYIDWHVQKIIGLYLMYMYLCKIPFPPLLIPKHK